MCTPEHVKTCTRTHTHAKKTLSISWLDEHFSSAYLPIVTAAKMQDAKGELPLLFYVRLSPPFVSLSMYFDEL